MDEIIPEQRRALGSYFLTVAILNYSIRGEKSCEFYFCTICRIKLVFLYTIPFAFDNIN
jgi:hypothetical protein